MVEATRLKNVAERSSSMPSPPIKFHENPPIDSKVINRGTRRQTGWRFDKHAFIIRK
jgi:hypothetical protein